jgi:hypothetical protein
VEARTPPRYAAFIPSARHQLSRIAPPIGVALAFAVWLTAWPALAEKYYIRQNGQVFEISETAAQALVPDEWWVYFFKRGATPSGNANSPGHWGSFFNKDLGKLLEEVRKAIEFDKDYRNAWWCNSDCKNDPYGYDNYFGPIANIRMNDPNRLPEMPAEIPREIARAKDLASQILDWWHDFEEASRITSLEDLRKLLEGKVKNLNLDHAAIKGFLQNLKRGIQGLGKLQSFMNNVGAQADEINQQLASVADDLKAASQTALKIKEASLTQPKAANGGITIKYPDEPFPYEGGEAKRNQTKTVNVQFGNRLNVQSTLSYTLWSKTIWHNGQCSPFKLLFSDGGRECASKAERLEGNGAKCDVDTCSREKNEGTKTETSSWSASTSDLTARLKRNSNDDPSSGWDVGLDCNDKEACIDWNENGEHSTERSASAPFATKEQAKDFVRKINAPKLLQPRQKFLRNEIMSLPPDIRKRFDENILSPYVGPQK